MNRFSNRSQSTHRNITSSFSLLRRNAMIDHWLFLSCSPLSDMAKFSLIGRMDREWNSDNWLTEKFNQSQLQFRDRFDQVCLVESIYRSFKFFSLILGAQICNRSFEKFLLKDILCVCLVLWVGDTSISINAKRLDYGRPKYFS